MDGILQILLFLNGWNFTNITIIEWMGFYKFSRRRTRGGGGGREEEESQSMDE